MWNAPPCAATGPGRPDPYCLTAPSRGTVKANPGSAPTLHAVVTHYDTLFGLGLTSAEKRDLVEYLKSL